MDELAQAFSRANSPVERKVLLVRAEALPDITSQEQVTSLQQS
jgi:hypothetical protein